MFTGIITDIGSVIAHEKGQDGSALRIATHYPTDSIAIGASIACNGICLTVTDKGTSDLSFPRKRESSASPNTIPAFAGMTKGGTTGWFAAHASAETLAVTTLGAWQAGDAINLERALKMGDELGGHLVQGHVDGVGSLHRITPAGASHQLSFTMPAALSPFIAPKGSVAIDGVSLTVNDVTADGFSVMIIPHTWSHTALSSLQEGSKVNLEIDLMARYVHRLHQMREAS